MTTNKIWFITGAGRGLGVDIAKAALAARHKVVATGRNPDKVAQAVGKSADLFVVKLDITKPTDAESAVKASVDKFGRIDVLVNNAANFYAGFFEELLPEQMERQLSTSLIGPMNVTRAVLPVMRKQRSGLIITISSTAGLIGFEFWKGYNGQQSGDPAKLAQALITISNQEKPPRRFIAGADAVGTAEQVAATLQQQTEAYRNLSSSLAYDKP